MSGGKRRNPGVRKKQSQRKKKKVCEMREMRIGKREERTRKK
jgi:hypothetical protein